MPNYCRRSVERKGRIKEVTAAAHCKFLFCLAAPSLPPSSASEEEEEAVKTLDRFTANGFTFIFPLLLGVNPSVFFSLFAFAFLHVATTTLSPGPPPPPAEKKSTTSLFPPLHTGFFCLFVGESRARPKKYSPPHPLFWRKKKKKKKGNSCVMLLLSSSSRPGGERRARRFFASAEKKP